MIIAVLSDIHDRLDHLATALEKIKGQECERLFYLGDLCSTFTLQALVEGFSGHINVVMGNNDGDPLFFSRIEAQYEHVHIHGHFAGIEVQDSKFALTHYPELARSLANSGDYSAVFYGHTHKADCRRLPNGTLIANPGELMGRFGRVTYGLYDSVNKYFEHIDITGA